MMDILKKIKEIDIAARCNNRVFYENLICWMDENFSPDDDCSIYQFVKSTQNDCKACISDNFRIGDTLYYYPFRLRVLAEYDLISEEEYRADLIDLGILNEWDLEWLETMIVSGFEETPELRLNLRDKCLELWERKMKGKQEND